jgi:PadR family transcriptional regulator, regulatory protein PadR
VNAQDNVPLLKGTLDLLVLKTLSVEAMHGYGIASWLEGRSSGALTVDDSALYQALHRLEGRRLVKAEWGVTENNRRARYYTLTSRGRSHLRQEAETWLRYTASVAAILSVDGRAAEAGG